MTERESAHPGYQQQQQQQLVGDISNGLKQVSLQQQQTVAAPAEPADQSVVSEFCVLNSSNIFYYFVYTACYNNLLYFAWNERSDLCANQ